ncbi:uncharacterized protein BO80DRAFT_138024 [Aspergillus ibericus CBS 121593]|uniref:Uncharacterized protein n=1 Tax=Aspergillus ibericus CBS 121593 TaxID=1448316 RepID=A0A395HDC0_9EURO|nr:hypothetical protein BO80DRAFT_138024 [Aspergillus ibericus CBS 121593]RAL05499.1 hypothetical protein BO80DRAFT_138024 [Aspergillus ibericus CBS 121593]
MEKEGKKTVNLLPNYKQRKTKTQNFPFGFASSSSFFSTSLSIFCIEFSWSPFSSRARETSKTLSPDLNAFRSSLCSGQLRRSWNLHTTTTTTTYQPTFNPSNPNLPPPRLLSSTPPSLSLSPSPDQPAKPVRELDHQTMC